MAIIQTILLCTLVRYTFSFIGNAPYTKRRCESQRALNLVPVRNFDCSFLEGSDDYRCCFDRNGTLQVGSGDTPPYQLCLVQEEDLPDVARFVVNAFGADVISLSKDFNRFEKAFVKPTIGLLNAYSGIVAYAEVLSGMLSRTRDRIDLDVPDLAGKSREEKLQEAARSSLILAVGRPSQGSDWHIDVVASVELRLEPCDAKIPFSFPLLDRIERRLASLVGLNNTARSLRPYLSNLCVDQNYRGKQLGKALVRCLEDITRSWGYNKLFLHVDLENDAARTLYKNAGYKDVGKRWTPFWAGPATKIGYFVKKVGKKETAKKASAAKSDDHAEVSKTEEFDMRRKAILYRRTCNE